MELGGSLPYSQQSTICPPYPSQNTPFLCQSHSWQAQLVSFLVGLRTYQHPDNYYTICWWAFCKEKRSVMCIIILNSRWLKFCVKFKPPSIISFSCLSKGFSRLDAFLAWRRNQSRLTKRHDSLNILKGNAGPLQAWSGTKGSRELRFPDFMTSAQDGGKVVSPTLRPPLPP